MQIYLHHTLDRPIDIDDLTGGYFFVAEKDELPPAELPIALRYSYMVKGTYTVEDNRQYYAYWNKNDVLVFQTSEGFKMELFRSVANEQYRDLTDGARLEVLPALSEDGLISPEFSVFRIVDTAGSEVLAVTYNSQRYLNLYMADVTFAADRDLSSWDFFVSLARGVEYMRERLSDEV